MAKTVAIIQGRMGSSRLPGKVLLEMGAKPMLQHVVERSRRALSLDVVLVATSSDPADDPVAQFCEAQDVICVRGSLHDVLDRYYQAAKTQAAEVVVRITADCPLIDPQLIDDCVATLVHRQLDFCANRLPPPFKRSFPIGLDVEVCRFAALERAWREASEAFQREHVMPFLYQGVRLERLDENLERGVSPRGFAVGLLNHKPDYGEMRWTVDTPEDLRFVRELFERLAGRPGFTWLDVLDVLRNEPGLAGINAAVQHKSMTDVDERSNLR